MCRYPKWSYTECRGAICETLHQTSALSSVLILFKCLLTRACDLYYEHITIVNYNSRIINEFGASLTDDARVIIYDCHLFIVQPTGFIL